MMTANSAKYMPKGISKVPVSAQSESKPTPSRKRMESLKRLRAIPQRVKAAAAAIGRNHCTARRTLKRLLDSMGSDGPIEVEIKKSRIGASKKLEGEEKGRGGGRGGRGGGIGVYTNLNCTSWTCQILHASREGRSKTTLRRDSPGPKPVELRPYVVSTKEFNANVTGNCNLQQSLAQPSRLLCPASSMSIVLRGAAGL
jgi:hypothetical protein